MHADGCRSRPWLACWPVSRPSYRTLLPNTLSVISGHFPSRWLHTSTYICKAEMLAFTDCDYCQTLVLTRRKFRVKFPGGPVPNPSTIRRQAKIFKETGSIKNRKMNRRRHVLTEEILDEIGQRLEHTPQKSLKCLSQETGVSVSSVQRATTLLKLHIYLVNIHTFAQ